MQPVHGLGIEQQRHFLARGELAGAVGQQPSPQLHEIPAHRVAAGTTLAQQRHVHGVHVGIKDGLHQTVVPAQFADGQHVPVTFFQVSLETHQLRRGLGFIRREEQAEFAGTASEPRATEQNGQWRRQHQPEQHRRQPPEKRRRDDIGGGAPDEAEQGLSRVRDDGLAPVGIIVRLALLRDPRHALPEQDVGDEFRMKHHVDGRKQRGDRGLQHRAHDKTHRAAVGRGAPVFQHEAEAQKLRQEDEQHRETEQRERLRHGHGMAEDEGIMPPRLCSPGIGGRAIEPVQRADEHEQQPDGRTEIAHDAHEQVKAVDGVKSARKQQPAMLEIALTPAPVALGVVNERGRPLLEAALEIVSQPHLPAGFAHERGLHEIVAQDASAKRFHAGQVGQRRVLHERRDTDHGVVTPEVALALVPVIQPGKKQRTVEPAGELLETREERDTVHDARSSLKDANRRIALHHRHELHDGFAGHDAVGIEHHHVAIAAAPTPEKVGHVAALLVYRDTALPVENASEGVELLAELGPGDLLLDPAVGVVGIAEDEEVELVEPAGLLQRTINDAQALEDAARILVEDRHHDGRAAERELVERLALDGTRDACRVAAVENVESEQRRAETGRDVREQDREQHQHGQIGEAAGPAPEQVGHEPRRQRREQEDEREERRAPPAHARFVHLLDCEGRGHDASKMWEGLYAPTYSDAGCHSRAHHKLARLGTHPALTGTPLDRGDPIPRSERLAKTSVVILWAARLRAHVQHARKRAAPLPSV